MTYSKLFGDVAILAVHVYKNIGFVYKSEFRLLSSVADDTLYCAVSPMEMKHIVFGRAVGGCVALLWHK